MPGWKVIKMTHEQRRGKLSSIIAALLCEQQSPILFPTMWNYQQFMVALLSKEVNCPFPFSGPPLPPLYSPHSPPFRVFSPQTTADDSFSHIVSEQTTSLIQNPIFPPLHDFKYLHTSDRRHPPPYLLLASPITDASSLCLAVWARVPTDFPVVSLPEPQSGVFQSRGRLSKVTPHSAAFFQRCSINRNYVAAHQREACYSQSRLEQRK